MRVVAALLGALGVAAVACNSGRPAETPPATAPPLRELAVPPIASVESKPTPRSVPEPEPPPPRPGFDHRSAAACEADVDCGFDDPCVPQRCVGSDAFDSSQKCAESRPPAGRCICLGGRCTLEPREQPQPDGPCEPRGCQVDRAGGRCVADTRGVAENLRSNPAVNVGPSCDCVDPAKGCEYTWHDPIPCRTVRDCWVAEEPRPHPIRRPPHLRGRDFRPCHDGEIPPACSDAGHCVLALAMAFSC